LQTRIKAAALVILAALVIGLFAPEHSTAIAYRLSLIAFVLLVFASRVYSAGIFNPQIFEYDEPPTSFPHLQASYQ
jgi:hypothetical protein